jgi:nitrite reductase/ring-hydroxylating ferredoxin subunit
MELNYAVITDLAPGKTRNVTVNGKDILVANAMGVYFAIGNICTHNGCKLSNGTLTGESLRCSCHGSTFSMRTGEVIKGPAKKPEPTYEIRYEAGEIRVMA